VRFYGLPGAGFVDPDESRALHPFSSWIFVRNPLFNLFYKIPLFLFGAGQDTALMTTAFLGVLNIAAVFWIGRALFDARTGSVAAFIFAFSGIHVHFSRTGYAVQMQVLMLLQAFGCWVGMLRSRGRLGWAAGFGILNGLAFLTYVPSVFAVMAAFGLTPFVMAAQKEPLGRILRVSVVALGSFAAVVLMNEIAGRLLFDVSYFSGLRDYQRKTAFDCAQAWARHGAELKGRAVRLWLYYSGPLQAAVLAAGVIYAMIHSVLKKSRRALLLCAFTGVCAAPLALSMMSGFHLPMVRRMLFLVPFCSVAAALMIGALRAKAGRVPAAALLVLLFVFFVPKAVRIHQETFRIRPIIEWFHERDIRLNRVVTSLKWLSDGDLHAVRPVPLYRSAETGLRTSRIAWPDLHRMRKKSRVRYLLTSGLGSQSEIGQDDPVLRGLTPLASWTHPCAKRKLSGKKTWQDFRVFDLREIFHGCAPVTEKVIRSEERTAAP